MSKPPDIPRVDAGPATVHWGFFDAKLAPVADRRQRRARHHVVGVRPARIDAAAAFRHPAGAAGDPCRQRQAALLRPYVHGPGGGARRQSGAGAAGRYRGDRAQLRLGLQHHPPARRRAARRLQGIPQHPPHARQSAHGRPAALGAGDSAAAVLRRDGGRAAGGLGRDPDAAAAPQRRQHGQQGAGRRHDALSADLHRRRAVLGRRRPRRAGRRRGLHHRHRDRARRHLQADRARRHETGMADGRDADACDHHGLRSRPRRLRRDRPAADARSGLRARRARPLPGLYAA